MNLRKKAADAWDNLELGSWPETFGQLLLLLVTVNLPLVIGWRRTGRQTWLGAHIVIPQVWQHNSSHMGLSFIFVCILLVKRKDGNFQQVLESFYSRNISLFFYVNNFSCLFTQLSKMSLNFVLDKNLSLDKPHPDWYTSSFDFLFSLEFVFVFQLGVHF